MKRRELIGSIAAAGAGLALPALAQGERSIVLGQSAAFTGPAAQLGIQ
ncbi:MAG TPA: ABC transporter permease, partial [Methylibium sp.]